MVATKATAGHGPMTKYWKKKHGEYLRSLRKAQGKTMQDVADACGYASYRFIWSYETGFSYIPVEKVQIAAEVFKVDPKELAINLLRWMNPWLFAMIYGADDQLALELRMASEGKGLTLPDAASARERARGRKRREKSEAVAE